MEFQLLRDVNSVVVAGSYKGQNVEMVVQLQQAETENAVAISSMQASQEADLGTEATFDLRLERSSVDVRRFQLKVINLPRQISYNFVDPGSRARLSQVNFPAGVTQQNLNLTLFLPERADEQVPIDEPLEFWALAMTDAQGAVRVGVGVQRVGHESVARDRAHRVQDGFVVDASRPDLGVHHPLPAPRKAEPTHHLKRTVPPRKLSRSTTVLFQPALPVQTLRPSRSCPAREKVPL